MKSIHSIRKPFWAYFLITLIFSIPISNNAYGEKMEEGSGTKAQMTPEAQAMMAKWQEYATPGENHKALDAMVGRWDYVVKWWMAPGTEPEISKGLNENQWLMGGRYLQLSVHGTSMGQPFEGLGLMGFNNGKKIYQSTWIDNMGTGMTTGESTYDAEKKIFSEKGTYTDPLQGDLSFRGEIKIIDDNHYTYTMHTPHTDGQEFLALEISYTRKK